VEERVGACLMVMAPSSATTTVVPSLSSKLPVVGALLPQPRWAQHERAKSAMMPVDDGRA
jgi:hypothetical protein